MKIKISLWSFVLLAACGQTEEMVKVEIDNPTVSSVEVNIDGKAYSIPAEGMQAIELPKGEHQFETKLEQSSLKGSFMADKDGMLNATGSEYVLWNELFLSKEVTPEEQEAIYVSVLKEDTIMLEGSKYIGSFVKYDRNNYFIPKTWEFNTLTAFPAKPQMTARYETKKKIFRKMPFIAEYDERYALDDKEVKRLTDSVLQAMSKEEIKQK